MQELSLKINVLNPNIGSLGMVANTGDGALKQSLDLLVTVVTECLGMDLHQLEIVLPQLDLR